MNLTINKILANDDDGLLIEEDVIDVYLLATGVRPNHVDANDCIDSTVTCDFAADVGLINLGDYGRGFLFFGRKGELFKTDERFSTFLTQVESEKGD